MNFPEAPHDEALQVYDLTKETLGTMDFETFEQTCTALAVAGTVALFRFLESQGYDYWLQKMSYSSFRPPRSSKKFDASLIEKLKQFVEVDFCQETKVIQHLEPYQLRLLSKIHDGETVLPADARVVYNDDGTAQETPE